MANRDPKSGENLSPNYYEQMSVLAANCSLAPLDGHKPGQDEGQTAMISPNLTILFHKVEGLVKINKKTDFLNRFPQWIRFVFQNGRELSHHECEFANMSMLRLAKTTATPHSLHETGHNFMG